MLPIPTVPLVTSGPLVPLFPLFLLFPVFYMFPCSLFFPVPFVPPVPLVALVSPFPSVPLVPCYIFTLSCCLVFCSHVLFLPCYLVSLLPLSFLSVFPCFLVLFLLFYLAALFSCYQLPLFPFFLTTVSENWKMEFVSFLTFFSASARSDNSRSRQRTRTVPSFWRREASVTDRPKVSTLRKCFMNCWGTRKQAGKVTREKCQRRD